MSLSNLLPRDHRAIEICSCGALIFAGLSILLGGEIPEVMKQVRPSPFWGVVLLHIGALQLLVLWLHPKFEVTQTAIALMAGTFWVWLGLSYLMEHSHANDWVALFLGLGNLYSFMVGFLYQRAKWRK